MSSALKPAERHETRHRGVDDRQRVGRAPGRRRPAMRAAPNGVRVPMMALLVARGVSVNAMWDGKFPIIFASCEAVDPAASRGARTRCRSNVTGPANSQEPRSITSSALTPVRQSLARVSMPSWEPEGGQVHIRAVPDLLSGRLDRLREQLVADPALIERHSRSSFRNPPAVAC